MRGPDLDPKARPWIRPFETDGIPIKFMAYMMLSHFFGGNDENLVINHQLSWAKFLGQTQIVHNGWLVKKMIHPCSIINYRISIAIHSPSVTIHENYKMSIH